MYGPAGKRRLTYNRPHTPLLYVHLLLDGKEPLRFPVGVYTAVLQLFTAISTEKTSMQSTAEKNASDMKTFRSCQAMNLMVYVLPRW